MPTTKPCAWHNVYLNFKRHAAQKAENLLLSLLRQLAQGQPSLPSSVKDLYERHGQRGTRPSMAEIGNTLGSVAVLYGQVSIVVDALDESPFEDRNMFLEVVSGLPRDSRVGVLAIPRPEILTHFAEYFEGHSTREIRAVGSDILDYVNRDLESPRRRRLTKHPDLQARISQKVVETADGMYVTQPGTTSFQLLSVSNALIPISRFLLAKLQMDYILSKSTPGDIEDALLDFRRGQEGLDFLYEQAMQRINSQPDGPNKLTTKVLEWIVHAKRPLKTMELREALAIRPGTRELDHKYLPEVDDMVSVSAGLVIIDGESGIIRLVHFHDAGILRADLCDVVPRRRHMSGVRNLPII